MSKLLDYLACTLYLIGLAAEWVFKAPPEPNWQYAEDGWTRTDPDSGLVQEFDEWGWR